MKLPQIVKDVFTTLPGILFAAVLVTVSYWGISWATGVFHKPTSFETAATSDSSSTSDAPFENCNVYGINLHGDVVTYDSKDSYDNISGKLNVDQTSADEVSSIIQEAESNDGIKAIVVDIDSTGGYPVAGEEMMTAFKNSTKPVVAYIRAEGDSAAYMAATGAEKIFASKFSDVGDIGVTMSYSENQSSSTFVSLSAGKFKDMGNPDKPLTAEEKALAMRDINLSYDYFVKMVAENRKLDIAKVKKLADGSTMMGEMALANGLIDQIGGLPEAENYLSKKIGEEPSICWKN